MESNVLGLDGHQLVRCWEKLSLLFYSSLTRENVNVIYR
jgi:hypothetical protein